MKKWVGMLAGIALLGAPVAYAGGDKANKDTSAEYGTEARSGAQEGMGGSGSEGAAATTGAEITGTVLKVAGNTLYVQNEGAVVPVELKKDTQFSGGISSKKDLKHGQQIKAQVNIENQQKNVASSVSLGSGTGGAGDFGQPTEEPGTGGAGEDWNNEGYGEDPSGVPGTGGAGEGWEVQPTDPMGVPDTGGSGDLETMEPEPGDGAVFDTGDTSQRSPGTIPEGGQPGPAEPLPEAGDVY